MALYCATKLFNRSLSYCLTDAFKDQIDVLCVTPAACRTPMTKGGKNCPNLVEAEDHAKAVID